MARGSLHELLYDYEDYMRTRLVPRWDKTNPRQIKLREICGQHNESDCFKSLIPAMDDEEYCNLMLTLIHQTISMLNKMIDKVKTDFLNKSGIKEEIYRARIAARNNPQKNY